jgi:mevalonate kinase
MISDAKKNGALGAKLTGAGLGGCVIALAGNKAIANIIANAWEKQGFDAWIMDMKEAI